MKVAREKRDAAMDECRADKVKFYDNVHISFQAFDKQHTSRQEKIENEFNNKVVELNCDVLNARLFDMTTVDVDVDVDESAGVK